MQAILDGARFSFACNSAGTRHFWESAVAHKQAAVTYLEASHPAHVFVTTATGASDWFYKHLDHAMIQDFLEEVDWEPWQDKNAARAARWVSALQQYKDQHLPDSDAVARAYSASATATTGDTVRLPNMTVLAEIQSEAAAAVAAGTEAAWQQEFSGRTVQQLRAFLYNRVLKFWKPNECELCAFLSSMQDQLVSPVYLGGVSIQRAQQLLYHMQHFKAQHPGKSLLRDSSKQPQQPEQPLLGKQLQWRALSADLQRHLSKQDVLANDSSRSPARVYLFCIKACQDAAAKDPGCPQAGHLSQIKDLLYPGWVPAAATAAAAAADTPALEPDANAAEDLSGSWRGTGAAPAVGRKRRCRHAAQDALSSSSSEDEESSDDDYFEDALPKRRRVSGSQCGRRRAANASSNSRARTARRSPAVVRKTASKGAKTSSAAAAKGAAAKGAAAAVSTNKRGPQSSVASAATRSCKRRAK